MSVCAGVGISNNSNHRVAVAEALYQAKASLQGKRISLVIVLSSFEFVSHELLEAIGDFAGKGVPLIGATSSAILDQEGIKRHALCIALISAEEARFNIAAINNNTPSSLEENGSKLGKELLSGIRSTGRRFCLSLTDGLVIDNLPFLRGIQQILGQSFPIIGATTASDNVYLHKTHQFCNRNVLTKTTVGLLCAGKVNFGFSIKHGWKPIGKPHYVNSTSNEFTIKEIENKPAALLYEDYFAKNKAELKKELSRISCLYPLGIDISQKGDYLLRNIIQIEKDGCLVCRGDVPAKSNIRLMIGNKESCLQAAEQAAKEAKESLAMQAFPRKAPAKIVFVFNSVSRLYLLGRRMAKELDIIRSHFPHTPIIGLCTFGEIGPLKTTEFVGKTYSHNQSISILAIS